MYKIGIISDTHGLLRPEVCKALKGCEVILHGGDIDKEGILDELQEIAKTYAVRGNNDGEWAGYLPEKLSIELFGIHFFMVHNKKLLPENTGGTDVFIYGHSHKYEERYTDGKLFLNPGSCGPRRFTQPITLAVLKTDGEGSISVERVEIAHYASKALKIQKTCAERKPEDMRRVILQVMRDTDHGMTVEKIAIKNQIDRALAEQICRLYLTHPGVSEEGIMTKMGL